MEKYQSSKYYPLDWQKFGSDAVDELFNKNNKYGIKIDFDKEICDKILKEVLNKNKIQFSCICGGFFTEPSSDKTADIFIYDGGKYFQNSESFLNSFLNDPYKKIEFDDLGKVAPSGIVAKKKAHLKNNQKICLFFTSIPFSKEDIYKYQLLDLFDLQPSKIMYFGGNKQFYLNNWFAIGGCIIPENKSPTKEFTEKYKKKGFDFQGDYFFPEKLK